MSGEEEKQGKWKAEDAENVGRELEVENGDVEGEKRRGEKSSRRTEE